MFVNTNVAALNAWRNLENTQLDMTGVLQRLSSGFRINTAADDPAGLAISQQMQSQIGGLNQAYLNAQSGISLLQTADGALGQIQNILQSMRNLASEAATATMNPTDAQNLQAEMNQYAAEITQIANTTQFNNINLLGGAFQNQSIQVGANQGQSTALSIGPADAYSLGVTGLTFGTPTDTGKVTAGSLSGVGIVTGNAPQNLTLNSSVSLWNISGYSDTGGTNQVVTKAQGAYSLTTADTITFSVTTNSSGNVVSVSYTDNNNPTAQTLALNVDSNGNVTGTLYGVTFNFGTNGNTAGQGKIGTTAGTYTATLTLNPTSTTLTMGGLSSTTNGTIAAGTPMSLTNNNGAALSFNAGTGLAQMTADTATYTGATLTTGAFGAAPTGWTQSGSTNVFTASVSFTAQQNGSAANNFVNGTGNASANDGTGQPSGLNILTQANAQAALTVIDNAINRLSSERANVGANQNRLQFAASDVQTTAQNLTAARAGIMDADMAMEMANLARDQVLEQSGVAMLAQANAVPQALLKLLP